MMDDNYKSGDAEHEVHERMASLYVSQYRLGQFVDKNAPRILVVHELLLLIRKASEVAFLLANDMTGSLYHGKEGPQ